MSHNLLRQQQEAAGISQGKLLQAERDGEYWEFFTNSFPGGKAAAAHQSSGGGRGGFPWSTANSLGGQEMSKRNFLGQEQISPARALGQEEPLHRVSFLSPVFSGWQEECS